MPKNRRSTAIAALTFAALATPAFAANWTNANGGGWGGASSWNTGAVPAPGENVNINLAAFNDFTVQANTTYTQAAPLGNLLVNSPRPSEITLAFTELHTDFWAANETFGDQYHAVAVHTGHTTNGITGSLYLGKSANGRGSYSLGGLALDVGVSTVVGGAGIGSFSQTSGTHTIRGNGTDSGLRIGQSPGSNGTYTLSGGALNVASQEFIGLSGLGSFVQSGGTNTTSYVYTGSTTANSGGGYVLSGGTLTTRYLDNHSSFTQSAGTLAPAYLSNNGGTMTLRGSLNVTGSGGANSGILQLGGKQSWADNTNFYNLDGGWLALETDTGSASRAALKLTANGGVIEIASDQHLASLTLAVVYGALPPSVHVNPAFNGSLPRTITVNQLAFTNITGTGPLGQLDLADGVLIARNLDPASVKGLLKPQPPAGSLPIGPLSSAIFSSLADAHHVLGYSAAAGGGQRITLATLGDANLSGGVEFADLVALAQNYGKPANMTWSTGDFDYDGDTDFNDLVTLAQNYSSSSASVTEFGSDFAADWTLAQSLVPEPGMISALLAVAAIRRRR